MPIFQLQFDLINLLRQEYSVTELRFLAQDHPARVLADRELKDLTGQNFQDLTKLLEEIKNKYLVQLDSVMPGAKAQPLEVTAKKVKGMKGEIRFKCDYLVSQIQEVDRVWRELQDYAARQRKGQASEKGAT